MRMSNEAKPSDAGEEQQLDGPELDGELRDFAEAQPDPHAHPRTRAASMRRARACASGRRRRRRTFRRSAWFSPRREEEKRLGLALALAALALAAASRCAGAPRRPRARLGHVPKRENGRFN